MTYFDGFVTPVPTANRDSYLAHAREAAAIFEEIGVERMVECWGEDIPIGKITDFRRSVEATDDEAVLFSWFEYPDKAARDSANQRMMSDPRMEQMAKDMPFDGKRMIYGGFESIIDVGAGGDGDYVDGFVLAVPDSQKDAYHALADTMAKLFLEQGALRVVEAVADDVKHGKQTDYYRAVQAEEGEHIVFSFIEWPDKATRDASWKSNMENDPGAGQAMPFDGKRMFWGGFAKILDTGREAA